MMRRMMMCMSYILKEIWVFKIIIIYATFS
jgi:hypothetical protein